MPRKLNLQCPILLRRTRRYSQQTVTPPQRNQLSPDQVEQLRTVAGTYLPDLHDAAAVEVLLVLLEVCHILDLSPSLLGRIFGARHLRALQSWGDILPPMQRPASLRRAWVWLPNQPAPRLHAIEEDGSIVVYPPGRLPWDRQ